MQNRPIDKPYIFISYSHDDKIKADKIYTKLTELGFDCWIDDDIEAMKNFHEDIQDGIEKCTVFLPLFSTSYVDKQYCQKEYDLATGFFKSKVVVCIDNVTPMTVDGTKHLFSQYTGLSLVGFGTGVDDDDESIAKFCEKIANCTRLACLKRYMESGDEKDLPPVSITPELLVCAKLHAERHYHHKGNYIFSKLNNNLFPEIIETDISRKVTENNTKTRKRYSDTENQQVSLISYLTASSENARKNIFLIGEGGNGKTVSLLQTCEYLLNQNRCAFYIPLKELRKNFSVDDYIRDRILGRNEILKKCFDEFLLTKNDSSPNIIILLDGVNEVENGEIEGIIHNIKESFIYQGFSVQFIMTSRNDSRHYFDLKNFALLELQPLNQRSIENYLQYRNLPTNIDKKIMSVIKTPLMLTLYANTEAYREQYENANGIELEKEPNTVGKILKNFFQTQLYRACEEDTFNFTEQLIILELLLPAIANHMIQSSDNSISEREILRYVREFRNQSPLYDWYEFNRLLPITTSRSNIDFGFLHKYAKDGLHFIHETDQGYDFTHQYFRDYFAAYHIANEIRAIGDNKKYLNESDVSLTKLTWNDDILKLVSDILKEEDATPYLSDGGWEFPGKSNDGPSKLSPAENIIGLWRDDESEEAKNAVYNLINIMKFGRKNLLAWCDFSGLDFRKCWLNNCRFVEWYEDKIYPSNFDGAWLDRELFINNGHSDQITSVCTDYNSLIFSGDKTGNIKVYNLKKKQWEFNLKLNSGPVIDMAWNEKDECLAILYSDAIFCYSIAEKKIVSTISNTNLYKNYRYVRYSQDGEIEFSYDLEPLLWYKSDGTLLPSDLEYDVPAKCAAWHPFKKEFIRSNMLQLVSVCQFDEETQAWIDHPAFKKVSYNHGNFHKRNVYKLDRKFIALREYSDIEARDDMKTIYCLTYNHDGSKFLVAVHNMLIEFDSVTLLPLHKRVFSNSIISVCYGKDSIIASNGIDIIILEEDFSSNSIIRGTQARNIRHFIADYDGNGFYILSMSGELKKLDSKLTVERIRTTPSKTNFTWAIDRRTKRKQFAFKPTRSCLDGLRYTYETAQAESLGWCYEFLDIPTHPDIRRYANDNKLMVIYNEPPYETLVFENYTGLHFYGCSFKGIRGNMSSDENQKFIRQNGGIINDGE